MVGKLKKYELSSFEKGLLELNLAGEFLTMVISFLDVNTNDLDKIKHSSLEALKYLQKRHPFLQGHICVENEDISVIVDEEEPVKIDLDIVDLSKQSSPPTRTDLIDRCAEFNTTEFDFTSRAIWRSQLIIYKVDSQTKLIFNLLIPSLITDGLSGTSLSIEFVNILNGLLTDKTTIEMSQQLGACESIHDHFLKSGLFNEQHIELAKELKSEKIDFTFNSLFNSDERGFYMDLFKLDKATSDLIIATSKKFGIRLTAYFYNVAFYTMKKLYDENRLELPKRFVLNFPINLRMKFEPNILPFSMPRLFVTFAEPVTQEACYGEFANFWNDAQYLQTLVEKSSDMKTGAALADVYLTLDSNLYTIDNEVDFFMSNLGAFVSNSMDVFPGPVHIDEIYCSDSLKNYPKISVTVGSHVFYWKGELMIQFAANKAFFSTVYCKRFVELFKQVIQESLN